jgi:aminopeptidase N
METPNKPDSPGVEPEVQSNFKDYTPSNRMWLVRQVEKKKVKAKQLSLKYNIKSPTFRVWKFRYGNGGILWGKRGRPSLYEQTDLEKIDDFVTGSSTNVAVDDFNMGAMENKSLNIFNTRLILATPATANDADFADVESVIAHEYFHNWSQGFRV